jgi:predicted AlkP superfamily pyrophosphatase or phosphodiesterase
VHWPVSVGANVDLNLPQYWRSGSADDRKLFAQLATPGLVAELEAKLGPYADGIDESVAGDVNRARFAQYLLETRKPDFMTMYLTALDHESHVSGPDTPQAHAALERIDGLIGELVDAAHRVAPDGVVAVVSDHGFTTLHDEVNLYTAFVDAGLIQTDNNGKVTHWDAMPWHNGGTAEIVLREGADEALRARVGEVLARLRSAPENGIDRVFDSAAIAKMGGDPHAAFFIAFKPGNMMSAERKQALHAPSQYRGMHGYAPDVPEMNATFLIEGKGIPAARALGEIDMRAIAPTLAKLLGVSLPQAESNPLFD